EGQGHDAKLTRQGDERARRRRRHGAHVTLARERTATSSGWKEIESRGRSYHQPTGFGRERDVGNPMQPTGAQCLRPEPGVGVEHLHARAATHRHVAGGGGNRCWRTHERCGETSDVYRTDSAAIPQRIAAVRLSPDEKADSTTDGRRRDGKAGNAACAMSGRSTRL